MELTKRNWQLLLLFFLINAITRLLFLNWHGGEYTDGIIMMSSDLLERSKWLPLYPLAIQLFNFIFNNLELSGKLVSNVSASLSVFPLFFLACRLDGERIGYYAVVLYSCSALIMRWSLHVMNDATFTLFFLLSLWCTSEFLADTKKKDLIFATIFSALSALTRPEGMIMVPILTLLYLWQLYQKGGREFMTTIWSALTWGLLPLWNILFVGRFLYGEQLLQESGTFSWYKFFTFLTGYLDIFPYILGYPLFAFALIGIYSLVKKETIWYVVLSAYLIFGWIVVLSLLTGWNPRYFFPLLPVVLIFTASGVETMEVKYNSLTRTKAMITLCVLYSVIFSGAVLYFQQDSFGDVKRNALFLKNNVSQKKVYSDEPWKTGFWYGKDVLLYSRNAVTKGDYLALHSLYTDLRKEWIYLSEKFKPRILYRTQSRIIPILSDDVVSSRFGDHLTNSPSNWAMRFTPQTFESVIIELQ
jgi:hypothetical protein